MTGAVLVAAPPGRTLLLLAAAWSAGCAAGPRADNPLAAYLAPTASIDAHHPDVLARAAAVAGGLRTSADRVAALALYVCHPRLDVPAGCHGDRASALVGCRDRSETQRVILLAAMARAAGIPARLAAERVIEPRSGAPGFRRVRPLVELYVDRAWRRIGVTADAPEVRTERLPGSFAGFDDALHRLIAAGGPAGPYSSHRQVDPAPAPCSAGRRLISSASARVAGRARARILRRHA